MKLIKDWQEVKTTNLISESCMGETSWGRVCLQWCPRVCSCVVCCWKQCWHEGLAWVSLRPCDSVPIGRILAGSGQAAQETALLWLLSFSDANFFFFFLECGMAVWTLRGKKLVRAPEGPSWFGGEGPQAMVLLVWRHSRSKGPWCSPGRWVRVTRLITKCTVRCEFHTSNK